MAEVYAGDSVLALGCRRNIIDLLLEEFIPNITTVPPPGLEEVGPKVLQKLSTF